MHFKIWMISCLDGRVKEKDSMQEWADKMGWTGRRIAVKFFVDFYSTCGYNKYTNKD